VGAQPDGLSWRANWALADDSDAGLAVAAGYEEDGSQGLAVSDKSGRVDLQVVRERPGTHGLGLSASWFAGRLHTRCCPIQVKVAREGAGLRNTRRSRRAIIRAVRGEMR
jgi:hypothetical protein